MYFSVMFVTVMNIEMTKTIHMMVSMYTSFTSSFTYPHRSPKCCNRRIALDWRWQKVSQVSTFVAYTLFAMPLIAFCAMNDQRMHLRFRCVTFYKIKCIVCKPLYRVDKRWDHQLSVSEHNKSVCCTTIFFISVSLCHCRAQTKENYTVS